MILVLLGTQNNSFRRLLEKIQKSIDNGIITDEVVVQKGYTEFLSDNMVLYNQLPQEELERLIDKADIIITHGGVGSIITSIKKNKKVIAVARLKKYNEHVNDHQLDIVKSFDNLGYIIGLDNVDNLDNAIIKIREFIPKKYKTNTGKILQIVENFIEKN